LGYLTIRLWVYKIQFGYKRGTLADFVSGVKGRMGEANLPQVNGKKVRLIFSAIIVCNGIVQRSVDFS